MNGAHWHRVRAFYRHHDMKIHQAGSTQWGIDPYSWEAEAGITMTPIERGLWVDIRTLGLVMYPQYPVGRRFVDFGNPGAKVAIECDGAKWHQDARADAERQREIEARGWTVYRFTGAECNRDGAESEDENGRVRYLPSQAYRRLKDIADAHPIRLWAPRRKAA